MTPRTASLRVAHQQHCANATKTSLKSVGRGSGCKCEPSYYAFRRRRDGGVEKSERVKTRKAASDLAHRWQVELDEGRTGTRRAKDVRLNEWADRYVQILEGRIRAGDRKPKTLRAYNETLALARLEFGDVLLREIGPTELRRLRGRLENQRPASRLRHFRQLSACLAVAVDESPPLIDTNPVPRFIKGLGLKAPKRGKAPFEDAELEALWAAYQSYEPVYGASARFSAESGLRLGELIALDWENVNLSDRRIYVEHTWDKEAGKVPPKDREPRHIYLTREAVEIIEEWVQIAEVRTEGPVFPNPIGGGRLVDRQAQRRLTNAMEDAGIPKTHPELRLPRSFHSLRYTTSNLMQRRGLHPRFIEQTLGHSTLELSFGVYGAWTPEQLSAEAARQG
jgi:integrase